MRSSTARVLAAAVSCCTLLTVAGCAGAAGSEGGSPRTTVSSPAAVARPQYVELARTLVAHGVAVWVEVDLVKAWRAGPQEFARALDISSAIAVLPGVRGIKIADELGYHDGMANPGQVRDFLLAARQQIRRRAPHAQILVDMVIPQLGCQAANAPTDERSDCLDHAGNSNPTCTIDAVDSYLALGAIDVFNVSAGLLDPNTYAAWGTTRDKAMEGAWTLVGQHRWPQLTTLQARKALAAPGGYAGNAAQAQQDVHTYIDIPLAHGAKGADVWTWSQKYQGQTVSLFGPRLTENPLTRLLEQRRAAGVDLATHMTPSSLIVSEAADVAAISKVFDTVYVAAGAG